MAEGQDPYRELFERSADAILIIEGDRFVDCNDATVRMLRYTNRAELLRAHPSELSPPTQPDGRDSYEKANEMIATAFERGSHRFEWAHQRADGEVFPVEVLLTAVEAEGRRVLHVVWRDITERRQLEEQLRRGQKMEAVGKLVGGIAHDFNNLLVVILGHAELLAKLVQDDPKLSAHTQAIEGAGQRAAALVKQLLAFGRKQQLLPEVVDLNGLLEKVKTLLERLIGEDLVLETHLAPMPLPVEVDPGQIEQLVMNLVSNARDASPEGGLLRLETVAVKGPELGDSSKATASGLCALMSITDSGTGMPPEVVERAFDPYFTTKAPGRGTGLGLSSAYSIVQQSSGHIEIESEPGHGTTVRVYLPLTTKMARDSPARQRPTAGTKLTGAGERILVVEDDENVRRMIVHLLEAWGYDVIQAGDGLAGVELYCENADSIDLLVTDVIMPRAGGPRMLSLLAERGHHPRVLFLSGYTDDALTSLHELSEGVDLLEKPFVPDKLAARVRAALGRSNP